MDPTARTRGWTRGLRENRKAGSGLAIEHCEGDFRFMARPLRLEFSWAVYSPSPITM